MCETQLQAKVGVFVCRFECLGPVFRRNKVFGTFGGEIRYVGARVGVWDVFVG